MHLFCDTVETSPLTGWWSALACAHGLVGATVNPGDDDEDDDEDDVGDGKEGGNIDPDEDEGYGDDDDEDDDEEPLRVARSTCHDRPRMLRRTNATAIAAARPDCRSAP